MSGARRTIAEICRDIKEWRVRHGFLTPSAIQEPFDQVAMLGKLMLVVTEVSEAAEAVRVGNTTDFAEEIADAVIRLFDIAETTGIDLEESIEVKMARNRERPFRHGKKCPL